MTPNKQPECVECTEHEMIREGSIHQIKAMNCRVKPLDPVFFDTTATEQPEWGKVAEKWLEKESVRVSVLTDLQTLIKEIISSRDTYWKEQLQKAREEERGRVVDEIAYAFSKHRDAELSELNRSNNRKETKEYLTKGIEVFYLEFLRRLDTVKPIDHSELDTPITNKDNLK